MVSCSPWEQSQEPETLFKFPLLLAECAVAVGAPRFCFSIYKLQVIMVPTICGNVKDYLRCIQPL